MTPEEFAPLLTNNTPPPTGAEDFGASYAVGESDPYTFYIWTRADIEAGGSHDTNYWLDIGLLAIEGIQGPSGANIVSARLNAQYNIVLTDSNGDEVIVSGSARGEKGDVGKEGPPNSIVGFTVDPNTYKATLTFADGSTATSNISIRGSQGSQGVGLPGPAGPSGRSIYIRAVVPSVNDIPTPPADFFGAYLVGASAPYDTYIPVEDTNSFVYAGQFMGGTVVTADNIVQDTWNADVKLDKYTTTGGGNKVYGVNNDGNQTMFTIRPDPQTGNSGTYKNQIVQYDVISNKNTGLIRIAETPTQDYHTASKYYVDNKYRLYRHKIQFYVDYNDTANVYLTIYDTAQSAKTYINTNGEMSATGYATISGENYPVFLVDIDSANSQATIWYLNQSTGQIENTNFDGGDMDITDTVSRII